MSNPITYRKMTPSDLAGVMAVELRTYPFPWSEGNFADCLRAGYEMYVALLGHQIVGYAVLSVAAGEAHVLNICVDPPRQRLGIGTHLLNLLIRAAERGGAEMLFLEVRQSNDAAQRRYEAAGFVEVGVRANYYPTHYGREDAIVLARQLSCTW
jgi:ribosomal-protein-alanine N-acetyltransferase